MRVYTETLMTGSDAEFTERGRLFQYRYPCGAVRGLVLKGVVKKRSWRNVGGFRKAVLFLINCLDKCSISCWIDVRSLFGGSFLLCFGNDSDLI